MDVKNAKNQINAALGRLLLGITLQLAPAQIQKIQAAVSDAAIQRIEKETAGEKGRYDLPRALDRFGQTGGAEAPNIETIAPEEYLGETGKAGEKKEAPKAGEPKKTPQTARTAQTTEKPDEETAEPKTSAQAEPSFQPFSEQTPQEQAAGPEAEKTQQNEVQKKDEKNYDTQEKVALESSEKGDLTQGVNALRFRKELKQIDKQLKELTKRKKVLGKELQNKERALAPFEKKLQRLANRIRLLRVIKWVCWALGALLSLFGIGELIVAGGLYLIPVIRGLHQKRILIKRAAHPFRKAVRDAQGKVNAVEIEIATLSHRAINMRNTSLFTRKKTQLAALNSYS